MNCPTCGHVVSAGTHFCGNCGAEVIAEKDELSAPDRGTVVDTGPVPYLVVAAGPAQGQTFELRGEARLGRDRSNAIVIADGKVSRSHARLDPIRDTYILTDLGSANGTFVNGVRISQPVRLREGDSIHVGDTQLVFHTHALARWSGHAPQADHASASPPPSPVPVASPSPASGGLTTWLRGGNIPNWMWLGCAILVIVLSLLVIVALTTGILIGQGLGGV